MSLPRLLLHAEGAAVAIAAVALYLYGDHPWWLLLGLALAPDLSVLGYLAGPRIGAFSYDTVHAYVGPVAVTTVGVVSEAETATAVGLVWLAHIGVDRALGYGLKYPTSFKDTHLGRV